MDIRIIALTGKAGHGKNTVAKAIDKKWRSWHGAVSPRKLFTREFALADLLKRECAAACGVPLTALTGEMGVEVKESFRPLMQAWGDLRKNPIAGGHLYYWTDALERKMLDAIEEAEAEGATHCLFLITDIRYDFEAAWASGIKSATHKLRTDVVEVVGTDVINGTTHTNHGSEAGIDPGLVTRQFINQQSLGLASLDNAIGRFIGAIGLLD